MIFGTLAEVARSLANPHRLMLLEHIAQGERPVERLAELSQLSLANASQHLQQLKRAGLVQARRDGKNVLYRLGDGPVQSLLAALHQYVAFRHGEISQFVSESVNRQADLESVSRGELLQRLSEGDVTLLDVRPSEEYRLGHLPGAINIPAEELEDRLAELTHQQEVIAYCRGPWCVLSQEAMTLLKRKGYRARCLEDGFPQWKAAGLHVEASE